MPPNFRRYLPIVLLAAVLLFVLPTLLKKKHTVLGHERRHARDSDDQRDAPN
jgi:hypothetical protein